jgi:hypothetical protein
MMTVGFKAKDARGGASLAADNIKANYDREFDVTNETGGGGGGGFLHSFTQSMDHVRKGPSGEDAPPAPMELHDKLIQDAAMQIASHLVNTTEQVEVMLARGGSLDEPVKLEQSKLWTRALESLETMKPFDTPEEDAYRLYDIGVANEALAYSSEDVGKARTYLQEAAIEQADRTGDCIGLRCARNAGPHTPGHRPHHLHRERRRRGVAGERLDPAWIFHVFPGAGPEQQNGTVSLSQAFAYVQHVRTRAQTEAHAAQNPVMSRSEDSTDFTLGGAPASAAVLRRPQAAIAAMLR